MRNLILTLLMSLIAGCAAAQTTGNVYLSRTGWTATACSQRSATTAGTDGVAQLVLDDNAASYWHSNWEQADCKTATHHWLVIDMLAEQTLNGFDYLPRPTGTNGTWLAGRAYVSNTDPAMTHAKAVELYAGTTHVGEFSGWGTANNSTYRTCTFSNAATGRYLIILTSSTSGGTPLSNTFASCAELKPWKVQDLSPVDFTPRAAGDNINGTLQRNGSGESVWKYRFQPTDGTIGAVITAYRNDNWTSPANTIQINTADNNLDLHIAHYVLTPSSPSYYISRVQFTATASAYSTGNNVYIKFPLGANTDITTTGTNFDFKFLPGQACQFDLTGSNNTNCVFSNFIITLTPITTAVTTRATLFNQAVDIFDMWNPILGDDLYRDYVSAIHTSAINLENTDDAVNTVVTAQKTAMMNELNGRPLYIRNVRRSGQPYLVTTSSTTVNTNAAKLNTAGWLIKTSDAASGKFKLYSLAENKYITASASHNGAVTPNAAESAATDFVIARNTSSNPGISLVIYGSTYGFNMDGNTGNLLSYDATDGGSAWKFEPLGLTPAEITNGKYVRIRSARAIQKFLGTGGNLLGVNTVLENGAGMTDAANIQNKNYGLGTIWKVEANGSTGTFFLRNLAADFDATGSNPNYLGGGGANTNLPTSSAKGSFTFVSAFGAGQAGTLCQRKLPTAVAIKTGANYLDTNGGNTGMGTWERCDNNWPNNGGLYFIEECTDVEAIKAAYIALGTNVVNNVTSTIDNVSYHAGNFTEYIAELEAAKNAAGTPTTVGQANRAAASLNSKLSDSYIWTKMPAALNGTYALMKTHYVENSTRPYMATNTTFTATAKNADLSSDPLMGIWKFEATADGSKVKIRNEKTGTYATVGSSLIELTSTGSEFYAYYDRTKNVNGDGHGGFGFSTNTSRSNTTSAIHVTSTICRWDLVANNSWFDLVALDSDLPISESNPNNNDITIDFGDATAINATGDTRVITVTQTARKRPSEEPLPSWSFTSQQIIDAGNRIVITDGTPGTYQLQVPMAFFARDGKYNAPITRTLQESTTGITDQMDIYPQEQVIYDLQGRRLNAPTHGINIINGRKVRF